MAEHSTTPSDLPLPMLLLQAVGDPVAETRVLGKQNGTVGQQYIGGRVLSAVLESALHTGSER